MIFYKFSCLIIFLFLIWAPGSFATKDVIIRPVHNALFKTFLPFNFKNAAIKKQILVLSEIEHSFAKFRNDAKLSQALLILSNLHFLYNKIGLKLYYKFFEKSNLDRKTVRNLNLKEIREFVCSRSNFDPILPVYKLSKQDRLKLFALLINSPINAHRQLAFYIRLSYLDIIYSSPLRLTISGLSDGKKLFATDSPKIPVLKTHLKYNFSKKRFIGRIDVIIAGSGASACVAAHELQKAGLKVLVLEKGAFVIPGAINTIANKRFFEKEGRRISADGSIGILNGEVVGGGPTINIDMSFPPTRDYVSHRFNLWHQQKIIAPKTWRPKEIKKSWEYIKNIFQPRIVNRSEVNKNNFLLAQGAYKLGIKPRAYELNKYENNKSPYEIYTKKSSLEKLLLPALTAKENPATLLSNCEVNRVIIKNNKAQGVICKYRILQQGAGIIRDPYDFKINSGAEIEIHADHILLAAGALGTTGILLNSNIKNKQIGRGFVLHPFIPLVGVFNKIVDAHIGEPSSILIDEFAPTDKNPNKPGFLIESHTAEANLVAIMNPGTPKQVGASLKNGRYLGGFAVMLLDSVDQNNFIEKENSGDLKINYSLPQQDKPRFLLGLKTSINILFAAGAQGVRFASFEDPQFQGSFLKANLITPDMDLDYIFKNFKFERNKTFLLSAHMMGTNKIGTDPESSVINQNQQVWDVKNLYIIDSSIFPTSVGANPMQTIYTVAKLFCNKFLHKIGYRKL